MGGTSLLGNGLHSEVCINDRSQRNRGCLQFCSGMKNIGNKGSNESKWPSFLSKVKACLEIHNLKFHGFRIPKIKRKLRSMDSRSHNQMRFHFYSFSTVHVPNFFFFLTRNINFNYLETLLFWEFTPPWHVPHKLVYHLFLGPKGALTACLMFYCQSNN